MSCQNVHKSTKIVSVAMAAGVGQRGDIRRTSHTRLLRMCEYVPNT